MKGIVTYFDKESSEGCIQAEDGRLLNFNSDSFSSKLNAQLLDADAKVNFECDKSDRVSDLSLQDDQPLLEEKIYYAEPSDIGISRADSVEGYELIDKSLYPISRESRSEKTIKLFLIEECRKFGGNVLLDYRQEKILKNSIGFSYYIYRGQAIPAVMGRKDDTASSSLHDLKHRLNHKGLLNYHQDEKSRATGLKIAKISGLILLIIFTVGFILSLDK